MSPLEISAFNYTVQCNRQYISEFRQLVHELSELVKRLEKLKGLKNEMEV